MQILNSTPADIPAIFGLYNAAIEYQKVVSPQQWKGFEQSLIETEIQENRQWKIMVNDQIACIFALTFSDPVIWGEKDKDKALYIHRIVTNPTFRGGSFVKHIVNWARTYAARQGIEYIRMDTWADNLRLLDYYVSCGFTYVGQVKVSNTGGLPKHYSDIHLSLFEIKV